MRATVDSTAAALSATSVATPRGVQLKARDDNAGTIAIGFASTVTVDADATTDGFTLTAGQGLFVPPSRASDLTAIYGIASVDSQKLDIFVL